MYNTPLESPSFSHFGGDLLSNFFQSRKRLYNHQCLLVSPSVSKPSQPLRINPHPSAFILQLLSFSAGFWQYLYVNINICFSCDGDMRGSLEGLSGYLLPHQSAIHNHSTRRESFLYRFNTILYSTTGCPPKKCGLSSFLNLKNKKYIRLLLQSFE